MRASINLKTLAAISLGVSTEETRYYLCGVMLEITANDVTYVACDGHRLMVRREALDEKDERNTLVGNFIVPTAKCKTFKLKKWDHKLADLTGNANSLTITHGTEGSAVTFKPIDGCFPDWRRVVPSKVSGETAQFDLAHLATFAKLAKELDCGRHPFVSYNGNGPAIIRFSEDSTFGLMMPVRHDGSSTDTPPEWFSLNAAPEMKLAA